VDVREFLASIINSLAWPAAVALVALLFRRELRGLLTRGLKRIKAGPFEAEWAEASAAVQATIRALPPSPIQKDAARISTIPGEPAKTIVMRHALLIQRLAQAVIGKCGPQDPDTDPLNLIDVAAREGLIDDTTRESLRGLTIMRNLAMRDPLNVTEDKAEDYVLLADGAQFAMNHWLSKYKPQ